MATKNGYSDAEVEALQKTGEAVAVEPGDGYSDDEVASLLKEGKASGWRRQLLRTKSRPLFDLPLRIYAFWGVRTCGVWGHCHKERD